MYNLKFVFMNAILLAIKTIQVFYIDLYVVQNSLVSNLSRISSAFMAGSFSYVNL